MNLTWLKQVFPFLILALLGGRGEIFAQDPLPAPSLLQENIKVQTHEIATGKILTLSAQNPERFLIAHPEVATVELKPQGLEVRAFKIGSTLLIWWDQKGIQSAQIVVTRPVEEIKQIKRIQRESSHLFQSQRSRTFKVSYNTEFFDLKQAKALSQVSEVQRVYFHEPQFQGATPFGDLKGKLFYEYRKDQNLRKSVALVRDMWLSLAGTDLPFGRLLDDYDMSVGRQYLKLSDYGFPGARYTGFTLVPSEKRIKNPEKGRFDLSFFVGRERRGTYLDNPAGTQRRDLKLKNRFTGEKLDFYLWKDGRISLGTYQKWGGPTNVFQSKRNSDMEFNLGVPYLRLKGTTGLDYRSNVAWQYAAVLQNSWFNLENTFFRINPHYTTITGTVLDKGRRGYRLNSYAFPFKPHWQSEALLVNMDAEISKDLLSLNPRRPDRHNKKLSVGTNWRLPAHFNSRTFFEYEDKKATSFPFTKRRIHENLGREFTFNWWWLKRLRVYGISTLERYGDAEGTPGFNSNRYEAGGGGYVSLLGNAWFSTQYLWNRLDEKEPSPPPEGRTRYGQMILSGGISRSLPILPLYTNVVVRYVDERKEIRRLHQPFSNENRFEVRGTINYQLPNSSVLFVETSASTAKPLNGDSKRAEFSLVFGARVNADTHVYLPQKGTIEGYVFFDRNVNGVRDTDESGVAGYEVWIQGGPRVKTDQQGYYKLRIPEGVVKLQTTAQLPEGYFFTTLNEQEIELLPKQKVKVDFGIVPQVQVKGQAYLDVNRNLIFDAGDIPMPSVQILLESGQLAVTSAQGLYSILRVRPGPNSAQAIITSIPAGYKTLTPVERKFEGMPGDIFTFDVAMTAERIVSGYVFEDRNGNATRDAEEPGVPGVLVSMGDQKTTTSSDGKFAFADLSPGSQKIKIEKESLPEFYKAIQLEQTVHVSEGYFVKNDVRFVVQRIEEPAVSNSEDKKPLR